MQCCKTVNLRFRDRRNGTQSLFLDYYPGYRDPKTMELKRRQSLGMYIYKNPTTAEQKEFNAVILKKAEAIRCKVYVDVINEKYEFFDKDKLKASFLEYYKEQIRNNYEKLEASYKHFEYFCDGSCVFEDIDMKLCKKYLSYLLTAKSMIHKKRISQNTAAAYWSVFKRMLGNAYRDNILRDNIADRLEFIPYVETHRQSLTLEEVRDMYATPCIVPQLRKASIFACLTGLRISDILQIKWDNIRTYADGGKYLEFICQKTKRKTVVPISQETFDLIQPKRGDLIFKGLKRQHTQKELREWIMDCGIDKHITFHCFRHTYASLQLEMGTDIYTVQHLLSHKHVSTTQIYASHADPKLREAADRITLTDVNLDKEKK